MELVSVGSAPAVAEVASLLGALKQYKCPPLIDFIVVLCCTSSYKWPSKMNVIIWLPTNKGLLDNTI